MQPLKLPFFVSFKNCLLLSKAYFLHSSSVTLFNGVPVSFVIILSLISKKFLFNISFKFIFFTHYIYIYILYYIKKKYLNKSLFFYL